MTQAPDLIAAYAGRSDGPVVSDDSHALDGVGLCRAVVDKIAVLRDQPPPRPSRNTLDALVTLLAALVSGLPVAPGPPDAGPPPLDRLPEGRVVLETSGSTGSAKWVRFTAASLIANGAACQRRFRLAAEDRVLLPVPLHHMFGLGAAVIPALLAGARLRIVERGDPLAIFAAERTFDPTVAFLVPSQCRSVMAMRRSNRPYRIVVVAGDRLAPDEAATFERRHGPVVPLYGCTELGAIAAALPDDPVDVRHRGLLVPMDGVAVSLPAGGADAPEPRRLAFRHPCGFEGYADRHGALVAAAPGIWTMGDLGTVDAAGRVRVHGRADAAVKRDGLLVMLPEIETCLATVAFVTDVAVVTTGQTRRGAGLVAFCQIRGPADPDASADILREHCRQALPGRAVPDRIVCMRQLPMLPSGKVDRKALGAQAATVIRG